MAHMIDMRDTVTAHQESCPTTRPWETVEPTRQCDDDGRDMVKVTRQCDHTIMTVHQCPACDYRRVYSGNQWYTPEEIAVAQAEALLGLADVDLGE